jgi:hypothetical protein
MLAARQAAQGFLAEIAKEHRQLGGARKDNSAIPFLTSPATTCRSTEAWPRSTWLFCGTEVGHQPDRNLLLDASASMNHRDDNGLTKFDSATGCCWRRLAHLVQQQGDSVAPPFSAWRAHFRSPADTASAPSTTRQPQAAGTAGCGQRLALLCCPAAVL